MTDTAQATSPLNAIRKLVVGCYAWLVAVCFGLAWLDTQYARLVPDARDAFREVADFLLFVTLVVATLGVAAFGLSWRSRKVRFHLAGSLAVAFAMPVLAQMLLARQVPDHPAYGSIVRLSIWGLASALAFAAFGRISRTG